MNMLTTRDGIQIFYKDFGPRDAQPIVFHHGWPLSSDARLIPADDLHYIEAGFETPLPLSAGEGGRVRVCSDESGKTLTSQSFGMGASCPAESGRG